MNAIVKYPRTQHIRGSRLQKDDEDDVMPIESIFTHYLVIEEKVDGANSGISFDDDGNLLLQCRGHYLTGGYRERHFNLFKTWANRHMNALFDILEDRYIMYGEWMYAKHASFYDALPHYFMEFDIYDKKTGLYLSTEERRKRIGAAPIVSVPVVWEGVADTKLNLQSLIRPSLYKTTTWRETLKRVVEDRELDLEKVLEQTNLSDLAEGLYIKDEAEGQVIGRYKFIRADFTQSILDSDSHWIDRPIVPNQLRPGVDIFSDNRPF